MDYYKRYYLVSFSISHTIFMAKRREKRKKKWVMGIVFIKKKEKLNSTQPIVTYKIVFDVWCHTEYQQHHSKTLQKRNENNFVLQVFAIYQRIHTLFTQSLALSLCLSVCVLYGAKKWKQFHKEGSKRKSR